MPFSHLQSFLESEKKRSIENFSLKPCFAEHQQIYVQCL